MEKIIPLITCEMLSVVFTVPDILRHRSERRPSGHRHRLDWCHFHSCLRILVLLTLQRNAGATVPRNRQDRFCGTLNSNSQTTEDTESHTKPTSEIRLGTETEKHHHSSLPGQERESRQACLQSNATRSISSSTLLISSLSLLPWTFSSPPLLYPYLLYPPSASC